MSAGHPSRLRLLTAALAALGLCVLSLVLTSAAGARQGTALAAARRLPTAGSCERRVLRSRARSLGRPGLARNRRARTLRSCHVAVQSTEPSGPLYWGAWIGDQLTGTEAPWDMEAVSRFERMTGKAMSMINFSAPFADCSSTPCSFYRFPTGSMQRIREHGSIPFFSWASQSTPASLEEPEFQLSDVISGRYDGYIREFAEEAKAWGHPFFLRFNWEMNGNWFEWSEGVNGNQAGEYVAAWRHVHDIFTEVGATNATWVWCPNVDPTGKLHELASLYPGNEYVDWTGLDGYNYGTNPAHPDRWRNFDQLYRTTYRELAEEIAPTKPMVIGEMGSTESGGSKADWIQEALSEVPSEFPKVRGLLWFEKYEDGMDWPIESSAAATSAFASGIQNPIYLGNEFGSITESPVAPAAR